MRLRADYQIPESGVLLHITSLPSRYGIGTLGDEAYRFVDFLKQSGQRYWQMLPLCPLGEGNSPYKSTCCFAGEPLLIDLEFLVRDGLLKAEELPEDTECTRVDYERIRQIKLPLLKKAAARFNRRRLDYIRFLKQNEFWLTDYASFTTALEVGNISSITDLEKGMKYRNPLALENFKNAYREEIEEKKIIEFFFYSQYYSFKHYANKNGIKIIGDIPIYVSLDSSDVWRSPDNFRLGQDMTPVVVAGVPPDEFSSDGQLWGNPIYDWEYQKRTGYAWWRKRLEFSFKIYDVVRVDHFRAFADYYTIPYGAKNARSGNWEKGAGISFWNTMEDRLGKMRIIAEDLGEESPEVQQLVVDTGFPNMKVLQFAFSDGLQNKFLPRNYQKNCVCYTGTHDNNTSLGWYNNATPHERQMFSKFVQSSGLKEPSHKMIWLAMRSRANTVIIPMQDWLCLDESARMNYPGTKTGNWEWRMHRDYSSEELLYIMRLLSNRR